MSSAPTARLRFAVALSFPGEYHDFVKGVADLLSAHFGKDRVLFDEYYEAEFARPDLDLYLPKIYSTQSELIVLFLCPEYENKRWCKLEWRSVRQLLATADSKRIMLLSHGRSGDYADLGIFSGDGVANFAGRSAEEVADLIIQRYEGPSAGPTPVRAPAPSSAAPQAAGALAIWKKRLAFLLEEEARAADASAKFSIQCSIEEARNKIRELGGVA
jgi:hypothetical protein